jgi:hypothetical protein
MNIALDHDVELCLEVSLVQPPTGSSYVTRTVKLANKNRARSCACLSPFVSGAVLGIDCEVGLDVLLSVPLGTTADARCVMGLVPVQAFC